MRIPVLCFGPIVEPGREAPSGPTPVATTSPAAAYDLERTPAGAITAAAAERARMTITVSKLERQLEYLAQNGFQTPILTDLLERRIDHEVTHRPAILTFDGGLEAHYKLVLPLLQKLNFRATFFLPRTAIDRPGGLARGEIEIMSRWGMGFGIQMPHAEELQRLSPMELADELETPRRQLEEIIGRPVKELSIQGPRLESSPLVRPFYERGYRGLCTYVLGNHFEQEDLLIVARYVVRRTVNADEWKNVVRMTSQGPARLAFFVRPLR